MKELSIVIPILNEAKNINQLIPEINKVKIKINLNRLEVLLIDDNSHDNIKNVVTRLKKRYPYLKLFIRKNKKKDLSKSCLEGFIKAKYKNILVMDGDLQHDPKYIEKFIDKFNLSSSDIIVGCRNFFYKDNKGLNFVRTYASVLLIFFINILLGKKTSDPLSGFFLFKKKLFVGSKKKFFGKGYKILADIIYNNKKVRVSDVKINFKKRLYGKSKINLKVLYYLLVFIIRKF